MCTDQDGCSTGLGLIKQLDEGAVGGSVQPAERFVEHEGTHRLQESLRDDHLLAVALGKGVEQDVRSRLKAEAGEELLAAALDLLGTESPDSAHVGEVLPSSELDPVG
jgi:hypothetical protein